MQRQLYNQGGIMNAVPREGYFLGKLAKGLKKGVKKIGKGVKKFAKSDLGKAAMLAAGAYFMPGIGIKAQGGLGSFLGKLGSKAATAGDFLKSKGGDFLRKPKLDMVLDSSGQTYIPKRSANRAVDSRLPRFEVGSGYFGEARDRDEGGIKSVLADFFQDEKKRNILADVLKGATSIAGGKMAYDDQKRINEARQKEFDDYVARRAAVSSQLEDVVPELDIRMANGGRVNYNNGGIMMMADLDAVRDSYSELMFGKPVEQLTPEELEEFEVLFEMEYYGKKPTQDNRQMASMDENEREFMRLVEEFMESGFNQEEAIEAARDELERKSLAMGGMPTGIMRTNEAGTIERDYRETGGFVPPIGIKEKADDIPAMLSNNEFVMTADAVRGMGNGSVNKGAKKLYALMREAEGKGRA